MKINFPLYVPFPLAWLRLFVNLVAMSLVAESAKLAEEDGAIIQHPSFLFGCVLALGGIGFIAHYPIRWILKKAGGVTEHFWIDSLWEGIFLVMVTLSSLTLSLLFSVGLYLDRIMNFGFMSDFSSDPEEALAVLLYLVFAVYLYHLEYLARHPHLTIAAKPSPKKNPPVTPPTKTPSPPLTPQQEIQKEIERLKKLNGK